MVKLKLIRELIATNQNTTRINAQKTRVSGNNIDIGGKQI